MPLPTPFTIITITAFRRLINQFDIVLVDIIIILLTLLTIPYIILSKVHNYPLLIDP